MCNYTNVDNTKNKRKQFPTTPNRLAFPSSLLPFLFSSDIFVVKLTIVISIFYISFLMSNNGCWHYFNTHKHPQFGVRWRKKLLSAVLARMAVKTVLLQNSSTALQGGCENSMVMRLPGIQAPLQLCRSAHLCSGMIWWEILGISALARERQSSTENAHSPSQRGAGLWAKVPALGSWLASPNANNTIKLL